MILAILKTQDQTRTGVKETLAERLFACRTCDRSWPTTNYSGRKFREV